MVCRADSATAMTAAIATTPTARRSLVWTLEIIRCRQPIPEAVRGEDVARLVPRLELPAEIGHVRVDRPVESFVIRAEDPGDELIAREDAAGVARQRRQQTEFGWRERHRAA